MKKENEIKEGHTYLVDKHNSIFSITILLITEKAYHIQLNHDNPSTTWWYKTDFDYKTDILEDITELEKNRKKYFISPKNSKQTYTLCYYCNGKGQVADDKSTAGTKTCAFCFGSGKILESIKIFD